MILLTALLMQSGQPGPMMPSARDLHTGCHLLLQGTDVPKRDGKAELFSGVVCSALELSAIAKREGAVESGDNRLRFCLPKTVEASTNSDRAMAAAYIDWYEQQPARANQMDGPIAFVVAMIDRWPCPSK